MLSSTKKENQGSAQKKKSFKLRQWITLTFLHCFGYCYKNNGHNHTFKE